MNKTFSIQFNFGVAGIFSSTIWILTKLGFFNLTTNEWLSLTMLALSFAAFYYYLNLMNSKFILITIFIFFISIVLFIYFFESTEISNRQNFSISLFYIAFVFALFTFFLIKSFYSNAKTNSVIALIFLVSALIGLFGFQTLISLIKSQHVVTFILKLKEVANYIINICLVLLILFPLKNIVKEIKSTKQLR